ncbi:MAG: RNA polymerase sigma factor [Myxococcota bacterium]
MQRAKLEAELERLHPEVFAWALVCCGGDRSEAEDVSQIAYLKVLDGRASFAGRSSFKTWIFGVVRRSAAERRRRAGLRAELFRRWVSGTPTPVRAVAKDLELGAESAELVRALARLPLRQRQVLTLVFYHDLSIREAAEALEVSLGSARTHYERGKRRLRLLLEAGG